MQAYTYIYVYIHTYTYIYVYIYVYIHIHIYTYMYTHIYVYAIEILWFYSFLWHIYDRYVHACMLSHFSCVWLLASLWTVAPRFLCPWHSPGKNTGESCHALLQGIFLTQGLNLHHLQLLHCTQIIYPSATREAHMTDLYHILIYSFSHNGHI